MHRVWGAEEGLPVNTATALVQTRDGYLWIGTQEGLVRYDGVTFTVFDRRNTPCLTDQWILRLSPMPDGSVWVIPLRGAPVLLEGGSLRCDPMPSGVPRTLIKSIVPAPGGTWFGAFGEGVFLVQAGRVVASYRGTPHDLLTSNKVVDLATTPDGSLWVATDGGGVNQIDPRGHLRVFDESRGLASDTVAKLLEANDGSIWVGTSKGVDVIADGHIRHIDDIPPIIVYAMTEDEQGALWFGTEASLFRLYEGEVAAFSEHDGLASRTVRSLLEDREGNLWVGSTGGGIERFSDSLFTPYSRVDGLSDDFVWAVYEDEPGRIWVGTNGGGLNRIEGNTIKTFGRAEGLDDDTVRSIFRSHDGTLWVGTRRGGLKRFDGARFHAVPVGDPRCFSDISEIAEDDSGVLWVGARGELASHGATGFLCRLDGGTLRVALPAEGGVEEFMSCLVRGRGGRLYLCGTRGFHVIEHGRVTSYSTRNGLSSDYVTSLYEDSEGVVWIGTSQGGLNRFKDGAFAHATRAEGMFDEKTHGIVEDDAGNLWLSSNRGIARVAKRDLADLFAGRTNRIEPVVYGAEHGMRTAECNGAAQYPAWRAADGRLWFATMKGAVVVDPQHLELNAVRPQVIIERFAADGVDRAMTPGLVLEPGSRALEFTYTATSLIASERIRFRYMLDGFDPDWVQAAGRRTAYYTNLPPGSYRFHVIAANSEGVWNTEGASIEFTLRAQFYRTGWFYGSCAFAALLLVFAAHRVRVRHLRKRERELQQRVDERTRQIEEGAQALRASESYSRAIVGNVGEAIITFDAEGQISGWNAAAERIFAYTADEAVGKTAAMLGLGVSPTAGGAPLDHARRRDGTVIPIEIHETAAVLDGAAMTIWLARDLTETRRAEAKVAAMQRELIATSRRAGMAQVATTVLHNVGNALTSVNLSAELVLETLRRSRSAGLTKALAMLDADPELAAALSSSERGRQLPTYLAKIDQAVQRERDKAIEELESMEKGIGHIKAIVDAQQSRAHVTGVDESVTIAELLDDAVRFERGLCELGGVQVRVDHADLPPVRVDRHRLLEIVMNLLVNAREALLDPRVTGTREIAIRTCSLEPGTFSIQIEDTGIGISSEDLLRIFHQGFTTKPDGHGFGLHGSSCTAIELGGHLSATSDGPGRGACFRLTLPIDRSRQAGRAA
jgi:ligand-binding sensor domain-containing protein/signal transduction histidine kinase